MFSLSHWRYGFSVAILLLQFRVVDDAAFARIDEEHLSGLKTALMHDVLRIGMSSTPTSDAMTTMSVFQSRSNATDEDRCDRAPRRSTCRR